MRTNITVILFAFLIGISPVLLAEDFTEKESCLIGYINSEKISVERPGFFYGINRVTEKAVVTNITSFKILDTKSDWGWGQISGLKQLMGEATGSALVFFTYTKTINGKVYTDEFITVISWKVEGAFGGTKIKDKVIIYNLKDIPELKAKTK